MGSIRLLYATQTRVPHCSHSQLNDGVDGNGISSTRGQASTSRNSKSGMYQRYTRNLLGLAINQENANIRSRLPAYHNREVSSQRTLSARHQSRRHLQQAEVVAVAAGMQVIVHILLWNERFVPFHRTIKGFSEQGWPFARLCG